MPELTKGEKVFEAELNLVVSNEIRGLVIEVLQLAPHYFWEVPSSSTGKHHPPDENRSGGKVLHSKRAVYLASQLATIYDLSRLDTDLLLAAMIIHDICSQGFSDAPSQKMDPDHPLLVRKVTTTLEGRLYYNDIMSIVETHMGRWGPVIPETKLQWLGHVADYISSRREVTIDVRYNND